MRFLRGGIEVLLLVFAVGCVSAETVVPTPHTVMQPKAPAYEPPPVTQTPTPPPYQPPVTTPPRTSPYTDLGGSRVVVDAGHGGKDPGTQGVSKMPEKSIVLDIASAVAADLRDRGAAVTMTRDRDVFIELDERAHIADKMHADAFVSVHADSHKSKSISGATIYVSPSASAASRRIATGIERELKAVGVDVKGIRTAKYRVLVGHSRPAVLVECGYLTNTSDAKSLNNDSYRDRIAAAIAKGVENGLRGS